MKKEIFMILILFGSLLMSGCNTDRQIIETGKVTYPGQNLSRNDSDNVTFVDVKERNCAMEYHVKVSLDVGEVGSVHHLIGDQHGYDLVWMIDDCYSHGEINHNRKELLANQILYETSLFGMGYDGCSYSEERFYPTYNENGTIEYYTKKLWTNDEKCQPIRYNIRFYD